MSNSNLFLFCWTRTRRSFCTTITKNPPPPLDFTKTPISRLPTVIILGRPNVGKSALFNRLIRRREALVYNTPDDHVTRDIREDCAMQRLFSTSKLWRTIPSYATHSFSTLSIAPIAPKLHESQHFMKWGFRMMSRFATGFNPLREKPLDSIVDVHRLKDRYPDDIASIWDDYHIGRGHIGGTMKSKLYHLLDHRAKECRYFVIPLWRGNGYTTMFLQVQTPYMVFTGLEDYKARGTQASPYFSVCFYTEFAETKDLVLIRGDIVFTSKLTDSEAKWLMETAQSFYLNDVRYKLVERFNKDPRDFDFKDVLQALDMPIL